MRPVRTVTVANCSGVDAASAAERNATSVRGRRRRRRSVSVERHVETLIVVDASMMDYYKNEDIDNYVLTIVNMVAYWCSQHTPCTTPLAALPSRRPLVTLLSLNTQEAQLSPRDRAMRRVS